MSASSMNDSCFPSNSSLLSLISTSVLLSTVSLYILLLLPLSLFIICLGLRRWLVSPTAAVSHSDFFTYNMAAIELLTAIGYILYYYCSPTPALLGVPGSVGAFIGLFTWFGQGLFPILTCIEHYLAVVHPVTYLGLRQAGGVRIRNVVTGCVWLVSLGGGGLLFHLLSSSVPLPVIFMPVLSLVVMTLLSIPVLCVLIRPGPVGGDRARVDQSKRRAVHTIVLILGALWLKFGWNVVSLVIVKADMRLKCLMTALVFVLSLPNSLLLPLLFLHRAANTRH